MKDKHDFKGELREAMRRAWVTNCPETFGEAMDYAVEEIMKTKPLRIADRLQSGGKFPVSKHLIKDLFDNSDGVQYDKFTRRCYISISPDALMDIKKELDVEIYTEILEEAMAAELIKEVEDEAR